MTDEKVDTQKLVSELEAAYSSFQEAHVRLHGAMSAAAQGLLAAGERIARLEADLETAKNHFRQTHTETGADRDQALLKIAALEGEIQTLRAAQEQAQSEAGGKKVAELEATIGTLTEHITQLALERDAHGQHAAAAAAELLQAQQLLKKRPELDYVHALEREKTQLTEDLHQARIQLETLKRDAAEAQKAAVEAQKATHDAQKAALEAQKAVVDAQKASAETQKAFAEAHRAATGDRPKKMTTSSARVTVAAPPPPVPEARAFANASSKPAEKPPGSLNLDELITRAKSVKGS